MAHDTHRRLLVVHNPYSSRAKHVQSEVFDRLDTAGVEYTRFSPPSPDTDTNIDALANVLRDGDLAISAAGDGTATQLANATLLHGGDVENGILPYGNFDDQAYAHMRHGQTVLDLLRADPIDVHPLDLSIDGTHWRYSTTYTTLGWSALTALRFSENGSKDIVRRLPEFATQGYSILQVIADYYLKRNQKLPQYFTNHDNEWRIDQTDILAINAQRVAASVGPSKRYYESTNFGFKELNVSKFFRNVPFGVRALGRHMPLIDLDHLDITFAEQSLVPIQHEGEFTLLSAREISIKKDPELVLKVRHSKD